jgi:Family of unknown function (DUF5995)
MTRKSRALFSALLASFCLAITPSIASADLLGTGINDPVTDWATVLPGLTPGYVPDDSNVCKSGKEACQASLYKEMDRRFQPLATSCSHNAMFALLYLRVTRHVWDSIWHQDYFSDRGFMTHYGAVFGNYYFDGYDAWARGSLSTPTAWKIALDAAKNKQVTGLGNLLLGMNAHINRDLPFVLYRIGLVAPDGTSRKDDHDLINNVLYQAYTEAIGEAARRFDPSLSAYTTPGSPESGIQTVIAWREEAWRNAERLATAANDAQRAVISQQIEQAANTEAALLKASYSYDGITSTSATRDAFCAAHHNDA